MAALPTSRNLPKEVINQPKKGVVTRNPSNVPLLNFFFYRPSPLSPKDVVVKWSGNIGKKKRGKKMVSQFDADISRRSLWESLPSFLPPLLYPANCSSRKHKREAPSSAEWVGMEGSSTKEGSDKTEKLDRKVFPPAGPKFDPPPKKKVLVVVVVAGNVDSWVILIMVRQGCQNQAVNASPLLFWPWSSDVSLPDKKKGVGEWVDSLPPLPSPPPSFQSLACLVHSARGFD